MEAMKLLFLQLLVVACYAENIDILQPIMRESPDSFQNGSLFGYSLALHQIAAGNPTQAMMNTRIVVSAPKRTTVNGQLDHTGAVYVCPVRPGPCERSVNSRLYDTAGNSGNENKTNQFLGASMASDGEYLVVCAHRFNLVSGNDRVIPGRCFASSNRDLSTFNDFQPCRQVDSLRLNSAGFCQVGMSSVILPGPVYGLGAPGYYGWRGNLMSMTSNTAANIQRLGFGVGTTDSINYLGYATTSGYFSDLSRLDYAVSVPRFGLYTGAVHIIIRDSSLTLVSQPALRGIQMGEGYGFSVLGANLLGDGYSELLVGAPFYRANGTQADAGRVFVYSNNRGSLSQLRIIVGFKALSRFGYAMANLGDISGDGYDDIAIGAPFSSTSESGVVYIYHSSSSQGLTLNYQQAIVGSQLSLTGVTDFRGFGAALVSGIDVDGNTYNDLAIGAFESQRVFLLRTRPIARTTTTFTASPPIVDLDLKNCLFSGQTYACFNVTVCAQYSGDGLSSTLMYQFNLTADTRSIEKRIFFNNNAVSILENVTLTGGSDSTCQLYTAYVMNGIVDRFNPFIMEFGVSVPLPTINEGNGDLSLQSFDDYPVLQLTGNRELQVETSKDCNGMVCIPDLRISVQGTTTILTDGSTRESDTIVVGGVRNVQIRLEVRNNGEDAFQAAVAITIPPELEFGRVVGRFSNNAMETLTCTAPIQNNDMTFSSSCSIGNPFVGPDNMVTVTATVMPRNPLNGDENDLSISFTATSINPENAATVNDGSNDASTTLKIAAEADITLDSTGIVSPEQLTYSRVPPNGSITRVDQLGPTFSVSFVVRNSGPSTVRNIKLVIYWPLNGTNSGNFYYLYPAQFSTSETGSTITCSNENINPNRTLTLADSNEQNEQGTTGTGGKRRKRSVPRRISKRQNVAVPDSTSTSTVTEDQSTINQTISCADSGPVLNCVPIECNIIGLQGTSNAQARVNIIGYVDERFFSTSIDRFSIIPNATITIIGGEFITQPNPDKGKNATATVRLIPAAIVAVGARRSVPWWVIVLPIVAALIVIVVVAVILWALGFFKRIKHEEIKQKREELENLEEHGITGGGGSTENIIAD